jgi:hypothetical protein
MMRANAGNENFLTFFTIATPVSSSFDASRPMRQIRSRMSAVVALSLAFVAHAGATAMYDSKLVEKESYWMKIVTAPPSVA